ASTRRALDLQDQILNHEGHEGNPNSVNTENTEDTEKTSPCTPCPLWFKNLSLHSFVSFVVQEVDVSPANTSATCSTFVFASPRRRSRPSMFSMQPRSPRTTASAPEPSMWTHLLSASLEEISPNLIENVPPNPQHISDSGISLSTSPRTFES